MDSLVATDMLLSDPRDSKAMGSWMANAQFESFLEASFDPRLALESPSTSMAFMTDDPMLGSTTTPASKQSSETLSMNTGPPSQPRIDTTTATCTPASEAPVALRMPETSPGTKERRIYIGPIPAKWDFICEQGGRSNHHLGNQRHRQNIADRKLRYKKLHVKTHKTNLARSLVAEFESYGGRFVKWDKNENQFYVLSKLEALRKTSQALREKRTHTRLVKTGFLKAEIATSPTN